VRNLEENLIDMKAFRRFINLVCNTFQIRFHKQHLQNLQNRIKEEFKIYFSIGTEQEIKVNAYGLTGAGLLFVNSTLKVQLRLHKAASKFAKLTEDLRARALPLRARPATEGGLKLVENSWFTVKHIRDQYVYLQLDQNDYTEEYNGVVFKVKFQHMQARREFLLAKLLNLYTFLDRNKFLAIAYFWIFFLKTNGFVGEKRGYLSSTTYLLMLVNYMQ